MISGDINFTIITISGIIKITGNKNETRLKIGIRRGEPSMKRIAAICLFLIIAFSLCACGGNVKNVQTHEVPSDIYSQTDIDSAIAVIKEEFKANWKGCTLTEIYYAGDDISKSYQDLADRNNADEAIVLLSSFYVDSSGGDGSLDPNSTYSDWNWILVRSDKGTWKHVDHGY